MKEIDEITGQVVDAAYKLRTGLGSISVLDTDKYGRTRIQKENYKFQATNSKLVLICVYLRRSVSLYHKRINRTYGVSA